MMNGFLCVNKPINVTSAKVVARVKALTGLKVGHLGTLDPLADGVLPIAIGKATRLFDYFLNKDKIYIASCRFGAETTTLDESGDIIKTCDVIPTKPDLEQVLNKFIGTYDQVPPNFSAKMVNGIRAYELARANVNFELKPKKITIYDLILVSYNSGVLTLKIHCSAGTYVRAVFRDIAYELNSLATTISITRISSGPFNIDKSIDYKDINKETITNNLIGIGDVLCGLQQVELTAEQEQKLKCGQMVYLEKEDTDNILFTTSKNAIYGIGSVKNGIILIKTYIFAENS